MSFQPLTFYETLSLLVSILGFAAVVITLYLMGRQTRRMTDSLKIAAFQADTAHMLSVDSLFIVHAEIRPYFHDGKVIDLNDPNSDKVLAMAGLLLDYFGSIIHQRPYVPQMYPSNWWNEYFIDMFASSPTLCEYLRKTAEYYPKELIQFMKAGEAKR